MLGKIKNGDVHSNIEDKLEGGKERKVIPGAKFEQSNRLKRNHFSSMPRACSFQWQIMCHAGEGA
jgi:hypothetical protein